MAISRSFLLRIKNVSDNPLEKIKANVLCAIFFFFENRVIYETMWNKSCTARHATYYIIRRMHIARWVPKATNTHSEYVTLIAFP